MFRIVPEIVYYDTFSQFSKAFGLGKRDLLVTNRWLYEGGVSASAPEVPVIFQEEYGAGEPSDEMIDAMAADMAAFDFDRIIAFGGGTVIDICKVLCLDFPEKAEQLFTGEAEAKKVKRLIAVPTTCGTGSEMTNVAIAELKSLHVKKGLASEETYADTAVLLAEPLESLPDYVFSASSIDAFIHAAESFLSPKASVYTEMYSLQAIRMILGGYRKILDRGGNSPENRKDLTKDYIIAANYAGIAFGNAGCAAVHALSYSIGGAFHVPHGEANYQFFTEVLRLYRKKAPGGRLRQFTQLCAEILGCGADSAIDRLEETLGRFLPRKPLREYGMEESQIDGFTDSTMENQQRLLANNYVPLDEEEIRGIFAALY